MEDLEAAKATIAEFNDHMGDVKDMLQEHREETMSQIEDLERRLQDIEDEPNQQSEVSRTLSGTGDFYDEGTDDVDEEPQHEDVML